MLTAYMYLREKFKTLKFNSRNLTIKILVDMDPELAIEKLLFTNLHHFLLPYWHRIKFGFNLLGKAAKTGILDNFNFVYNKLEKPQDLKHYCSFIYSIVERGYLEILQRVCDLIGYDIIENKGLMIIAMSENQLHIAKWIYDLRKSYLARCTQSTILHKLILNENNDMLEIFFKIVENFNYETDLFVSVAQEKFIDLYIHFLVTTNRRHIIHKSQSNIWIIISVCNYRTFRYIYDVDSRESYLIYILLKRNLRYISNNEITAFCYQKLEHLLSGKEFEFFTENNQDIHYFYIFMQKIYPKFDYKLYAKNKIKKDIKNKEYEKLCKFLLFLKTCNYYCPIIKKNDDLLPYLEKNGLNTYVSASW